MSEYFRGEGGLKFWCCNKLEGRSLVNQGQNSDMGEGGIKTGQKNSDVFYGRPLMCINCHWWSLFHQLQMLGGISHLHIWGFIKIFKYSKWFRFASSSNYISFFLCLKELRSKEAVLDDKQREQKMIEER